VSPFALELALGVVMLVVFVASLAGRGTDRRWIAWLATLGILGVGILSVFREADAAGAPGHVRPGRARDLSRNASSWPRPSSGSWPESPETASRAAAARASITC